MFNQNYVFKNLTSFQGKPSTIITIYDIKVLQYNLNLYVWSGSAKGFSNPFKDWTMHPIFITIVVSKFINSHIGLLHCNAATTTVFDRFRQSNLCIKSLRWVIYFMHRKQVRVGSIVQISLQIRNWNLPQPRYLLASQCKHCTNMQVRSIRVDLL